MRTGLALLAIMLLIPAQDKEEDRARIDSLIQQEDWKTAQKALKAYLRKHAETPDEKAEIQTLLDRATGLVALEKIQKEYQRSGRVRRASGKMEDLLKDHPGDPIIRERGQAVLQALRAEYILVLEDFEDWGKKDEKEKEEPILQRGSVTLEANTEFVKEGKQSGRWASKSSAGSFWVIPTETDWSDYDLFCVWIYACKRPQKRIGHLRLEIRTRAGGYYTTLIALDWEGWKNIQLPMKGKNAGFSSDSRGDWSSIYKLYLYQTDTFPTAFEIVLDDMRLEKAVK